MKYLVKFYRLLPDERWLLFEALFCLLYSKLLLLMPFKYYIKRIKPLEIPEQEFDSGLLKKIGEAVYRANKLALWKNVCLVRSFAARLMLQRRKIVSTLYFGLQMKDGKELIAHAWLVSHNIYLTPKGRTAYKEIYSI